MMSAALAQDSEMPFALWLVASTKLPPVKIRSEAILIALGCLVCRTAKN